MKVNSLAFRLVATAVAWALLVLPLAALIISSLYRQDAQTAFDERIKLLLTLIVADSLEKGTTAPGQPRGTGEPQFEFPQSGWYWQIKPVGGRRADRGRSLGREEAAAQQAVAGAKRPPANDSATRLISPSLTSDSLQVPSDRKMPGRNEDYVWANVVGPVGEALRVAELVQPLGPEDNPTYYSYAVAGPLDEVNQAVSNLRYRLLLSLALAGFSLLAVTVVQVRFGLLPLRAIGRGLASIRSGEATKLEGDLPAEIEPLQHELNALIQSNQDIIDRARTQVGNLAHALKTPLAVITNEADERDGPFALKVAEQAKVMRDQVSHYLDRARMAARVGVIGRKTQIQPILQSLGRVLGKIYSDRGIAFEIDCGSTESFQGEKQDLEEMLGNLMDNAGKWARRKVTITVSTQTAGDNKRKFIRIRIEDDGPGLSPDERKLALKRGRRLDETVPGSGLGLSIVDDLAQSYQGRVELGRSEAGGLRADLYLPAQ